MDNNWLYIWLIIENFISLCFSKSVRNESQDKELFEQLNEMLWREKSKCNHA